MNLKVQVGTRRARLTAGFPEELWHIVMQGFCFCVGWWFAAMRDSANEFPKCLQGATANRRAKQGMLSHGFL